MKHPAIFERLKNEGHAIGNHTFNHLKGWKTDDQTYVDNFLKCQALTQTHLFRPPYGRIKKSQVRKIQAEAQSWDPEVYLSKNPGSTTQNSKLEIMMWDVLSGDFDTTLSPEKCYQNVIRNTKNGAIIVFHDSLKAFDRLQYALPKTIQYLSDKGYQFGTL